MASILRSVMMLALLFHAVTTEAEAQTRLEVVAWNIESSDSNADSVAERIRAFDGVDLWGLSDVDPADQPTLQRGAGIGEGAFFHGVIGQTGGNARLLIIYDVMRFDLIELQELNELNDPSLSHRSPLVARFLDRESGREFLFMVNHLARRNIVLRIEQAFQLRNWAAEQKLPVIAVGDYNFDWNVQNGETNHDLGYDLLTDGGAFEWVRPDSLVATQCSVNFSGLPDCRFDSVLDFVFVSGLAKHWPATSEISVQPGDFPDDSLTSDHRPVKASLQIPLVGADLKSDLLVRLMALEAEIAALRRTAEQLP